MIQMMRNMISRTKRVFRINVWLTVAAVILLIVVGIILWKGCLYAAGMNRASDSINVMLKKDLENSGDGLSDDFDGEKTINLTVKIYDNAAYLTNSDGEPVFGPCRYIYDEFDSGVFRYIDNNGLIGYGKAEDAGITVLCPGMFSEAGKMFDGSACVKEGEDIYYIDTEGKRFTMGKYMDAYPFGESQGRYARVQKMDGSWCIIDRQENEFLTGFEYINELPYLTSIGSGIKDGKAVLFSIDCYNEYTEPTIINEYEEYADISECYTHFVFVTLKTGKKGVVCIPSGEVIVPADYVDIECGLYDDENSVPEKKTWFKCQKEDGSYDLIYWDF